jgi:hypothetical protein
MIKRALLLLITLFIAIAFIESSEADNIIQIEQQVVTLENELEPIPSKREIKQRDPKSCADNLHAQQKDIASELKKIKKMLAERSRKR